MERYRVGEDLFETLQWSDAIWVEDHIPQKTIARLIGGSTQITMLCWSGCGYGKYGYGWYVGCGVGYRDGCSVGYGNGHGYGYGDGDGYGYGNGHGYGYGDGDGYGYGYGYGNDFGYGYGYGFGNDFGFGNGDILVGVLGDQVEEPPEAPPRPTRIRFTLGGE